MTPETVLTIGRHAMEVVVMISMTLLIPGLLIGLLVAMFQAATQVNEMTLSFIPKLLITFAVIIIAGPWMLKVLVTYTRTLFENIPGVIG